MAIFFYKKAPEIPCDEAEAARYLGYARASLPQGEVAELLHSSCAELQRIIVPQAVYAVFPLSAGQDYQLYFAGQQVQSSDLTKNLEGCSQVALFAATIGPQVDAYIRRAQAQSRAKAAVLQGAAAMFTENFVELLNAHIRQQAAAEGRRTHPRYSPGYGDVPLAVQKIFFSLLPCSRIGLTLMDTLIMAPEKSVTAFVGIE
ncbi:MAG TPA: Vitamin B12 dependent methionine synthase activation subunit [Treponema sp.]|nr:Vitamin B12 dependent methionine synthase activation subunit [Treponema sp.]